LSKVQYQIDGDYFRIWVSDDLDPSEIELDQRSAGMQYFFSFFTVFLVEAEDAHANSILLMDEPGLHLHGTAQTKVVKFLEKLSKDNQTLYTTHSPFMVDVDHLENARAVYEHDDGTTKVSEDVWPRDVDSLFPLQAALGYQIAQGLFISKRQLIVEGITDLWLLKAIDQALGVKGGKRLRPDLVIVPSAGLTKLLPLAGMLIGHNIEIAALLDGDEPGRKEGKKLDEKLLAGKDRKCLFIGDFVDNSQAELEDTFPEEFYLSAVKEAYPTVELSFNEAERKLAGVVDRIESLFVRNGHGEFEKWRPASILRDRILASPEDIPQPLYEVMNRIFGAINNLFTTPSHSATETKQ
jgi:predicted ATP-dependent endonuclease of OLD family